MDKDRQKGIAGTILFHLMLLLALFFMALRTPLPLPGEEGVEVNLGYSDRGMGNVQPDQPAPASQPVPMPEPIATEEVKEKIVTQDTEEAPSLPEPVKEKPKEVVKQPVKQPEPVEEKPKEPQVNQRALFKGSNTATGEGGSEGVTGDPGDQGRPDGLKDVQRYDGRGGQGDGPSFSLGGRGSKYLDRPAGEFRDQGNVVVDIWVDRNGIVKRAQVQAKGTTITDANVRNMAVRAALNSTFSEDSSATELQKGTITYTFIIRR
jgi:outer membrane biosynthesis protein TonB